MNVIGVTISALGCIIALIGIILITIKANKNKSIEINAFVVFDKESCSIDIYERYYKEIFEGKLFVFLGEIKQCSGHCILCDLSDGKIIGMYHTENFREATENEY